jgi:hypothetical protein
MWFEVFTTAEIWIVVFWVGTPCTVVYCSNVAEELVIFIFGVTSQKVTVYSFIDINRVSVKEAPVNAKSCMTNMCYLVSSRCIFPCLVCGLLWQCHVMKFYAPFSYYRNKATSLNRDLFKISVTSFWTYYLLYRSVLFHTTVDFYLAPSL